MPKTWNLRTKIVNALRKVWVCYPVRNQVLKRAFIGKGWYRCELCQKEMEKPKADHIVPIVDTKRGFVDWNTYINRLFCDAENIQAICSTCHEVKTKQEKKERKLHEKKKETS